jgi:hypothetical protein
MSIRLALSLALMLIVAGCAVRQETPDSIVVEYDAYHPWLADATAKDHCARYGKVPFLVKRTESAPSPRMFYLLSQFAVYECIDADKRHRP